MLLALTVLALVSATRVGAQEGRPPRIVCYYTPGDPEIEDIPGDLCTHVLYGFAKLSEETWEIIPGDYKVDIEEGGYRRFTALKETYPHLKTDLSFGDPTLTYMIRYKERRDTFTKSVVSYLKEYGFDGLDIDWEFPTLPIDKKNYPIWLDELRAAFDAEGLGWNLTIAVPASTILTDIGYDVPALCRSLDAVNFMGYDLRSQAEGFADVHSLLYRRPKLDLFIFYDFNVHDGIFKWVEEGCPREKLILGVPFYSRDFRLLDPEKHGLHALAEFNVGGSSSYMTICKKLLEEPGWVQEYDDIGLVPFAYKDKDWSSYEDRDSVLIKMDHIQNMGYGGAMNFRINTDDWTGVCGQGTYPLLKAMNEGLQNYTVPLTSSSNESEV